MPATLSWNPLVMGDNEVELYLYDPATAIRIDMKKQSSYTFRPTGSYPLQFHYTSENAPIAPSKIVIGAAAPNPFSQAVSIPFTLSDVFDKYPVQIQVIDGMGRNIKTLFSGELASGFHRAEWNGTASTGSTVPQGLYLVRFQIGTYSLDQSVRVLFKP
jgi:hypothetical protein